MEYIEKIPYLIIAGGGIILIGLTLTWLSRLQKKAIISRKKRELEKLLAGQPLKEVLSNSPYKYGHFQGEDGFRVWDERSEEYLGIFSTELDAQVWIVERNRYKREQ